MFQIPAAFAPLFMATFVLLIVGAMIWIVVPALRRGEPEAVASLEAWRPSFLTRLQMDGRWSHTGSMFKRTMSCVLYAPSGQPGEARRMPKAARFLHVVQAIGPFVWQASTRLETQHCEVELEAANYFELLPQFGLQAKRWTVTVDGVVIGTLGRRDGAIVARDTAGQPVATWIVPSVPGRLRYPVVGEDEARRPWYTSLEILGEHAHLRLPFFDGRQHPYDFAGVSFIEGMKPQAGAIEDWALAFVALSSQAALALRIATPRKASAPRDVTNQTRVML